MAPRCRSVLRASAEPSRPADTGWHPIGGERRDWHISLQTSKAPRGLAAIWTRTVAAKPLNAESTSNGRAVRSMRNLKRGHNPLTHASGPGTKRGVARRQSDLRPRRCRLEQVGSLTPAIVIQPQHSGTSQRPEVIVIELRVGGQHTPMRFSTQQHHRVTQCRGLRSCKGLR